MLTASCYNLVYYTQSIMLAESKLSGQSYTGAQTHATIVSCLLHDVAFILAVYTLQYVQWGKFVPTKPEVIHVLLGI